jgi:hypothetical protein
MKRNQERRKPHLEVAAKPNMLPHFEIEVKTKIKSKAEEKLVRRRLERLGFVFEKRTLIVDFLQPSKCVTSRVRFEKPIDGTGDPVVTCAMGKKTHPIEGELEEFVRHEQDPELTAETAVDLLVRAIEAHNGKPIPYYTKKRRHGTGLLNGHHTEVALDRPKGLRKRYLKRFLEVEIQLPLTSTEDEIAAVVNDIRGLNVQVFRDKRKPQISYRRMLMRTWRKRGLVDD